MDVQIEQDGPEISRDQMANACRALGYDSVDVRSIEIRGTGPVVVEVFLRLPYPGSERGVRFIPEPGSGYARARITHNVVMNKHANQEEN